MEQTALARQILEGTVPNSLEGLEVPASTFLAGRCTSTFNLAWRLLESDLLPEWGAALCSCQTEGRGQLRRNWHSPRGNLHVSFRLPGDPNLKGDAASLVLGGLLVRAFERLGLSLSLKWPNDLLLAESGKAGGVLLEERDGVILAGLGVNLAASPPETMLRADRAVPAVALPPPDRGRPPGGTDAGGGTGNTWQSLPPAPFSLWRHLVSAAILEYTCSVKGRSLPCVLSDLERLLAWRGKQVTLTEADGSSFSGCYLGLGERGALRLLSAAGWVHEFFSGSLALSAIAETK